MPEEDQKAIESAWDVVKGREEGFIQYGWGQRWKQNIVSCLFSVLFALDKLAIEVWMDSCTLPPKVVVRTPEEYTFLYRPNTSSCIDAKFHPWIKV